MRQPATASGNSRRPSGTDPRPRIFATPVARLHRSMRATTARRRGTGVAPRNLPAAPRPGETQGAVDAISHLRATRSRARRDRPRRRGVHVPEPTGVDDGRRPRRPDGRSDGRARRRLSRSGDGGSDGRPRCSDDVRCARCRRAWRRRGPARRRIRRARSGARSRRRSRRCFTGGGRRSHGPPRHRGVDELPPPVKKETTRLRVAGPGSVA